MSNNRQARTTCSIFLLLAIPVSAQTLVESDPNAFAAGGNGAGIANPVSPAIATSISPLGTNVGSLGSGVELGSGVLPSAQPHFLSNPSFGSLTAHGVQELAAGLTYSERDFIGASPLFGPVTWKTPPIHLPTRMPASAWPARRTGINGQIVPNFGSHPWSLVHATPSIAPDSPKALAPDEIALPHLHRKTPDSSVDSRTASRPTEIADTGIPTGEDFFSDMKEVISRLQRLRRDQADAVSGARDVPSLNESYQNILSLVRETSSEPLTSLAARGGGPSERYARSAETAVRKGDFYRAVSHYRIAQAADPTNPLLYLGEATAAIGAGEHFTAIRKIERGLALFPEVAYFKLDLNAFVTDPEVLDVRRADLETRLAAREDYRFRFLLGFIEYYSGLEEFGLANLKRAAADAPRESPIAQFPTSLRVGRVLLDAAKAPATKTSMR